MTPYFIEPNPADLMRARMDAYGAAVRRIAADRHTLLVDTQAAFNQVLQTYHPMYFAWDRVHPTPVGHMLLARTFLNAIGFQWNGEA
jgi:lysophospholipase L1-like esterase